MGKEAEVRFLIMALFVVAMFLMLYAMSEFGKIA